MSELPDTDKITQGYLPAYRRILEDFGGRPVRICEIGVLTGESLKLWQYLTPPGTIIVGVDNGSEAKWPCGTFDLHLDQINSELPNALKCYAEEYDLIVDDASHNGNYSRITFNNLWPLVRPGGYYVVEDWFVGFPDHHYSYGESMNVFAKQLVDMLNGHDCESIEYRYGQIIIKKASLIPYLVE